MTKQVFEIISDATLLENSIAIGAVIIRHKDVEASVFQPGYRYITPFKAKDSQEAELLAGLCGITKILEQIKLEDIDFTKSRWIMDLPHIGEIIKKISQGKSSPATFLDSSKITQALDIIKLSGLSIELPRGKDLVYKHNLCHRHCSMARTFIMESGNMPYNFNLLSDYFNKKYPSWIICDQFIQDI